MKKDQIAVFGSAFNPPHRGHEDVIHQILEHTDKLVLVPSYNHAFGKKMMPFEFRVGLVKGMVAEMGLNENTLVSRIEHDIADTHPEDRPVYTFDVLSELEKVYNTQNLTFVVGPDNASPSTWKRFYNADEILTRWNIWAAEERIKVRSTMIREKLDKGSAPSNEECCEFVITQLTNTYIEQI